LLAGTIGAGAALDGLTGTAGAAGGPSAVASGLVSCVLTPELTEGPYSIAGEKVRRNITEGKPGAALELRLKVLDVSSCKPVRGATVDIWHCDAGGLYSGFVAASTGGGFGGGGGPTDKRTFLRGIQPTDADDSIYRNGGSRSLLAVTPRGKGYVGAVAMGVHRT